MRTFIKVISGLLALALMLLLVGTRFLAVDALGVWLRLS